MSDSINLIPYIVETNDGAFVIIGDSDALAALGHALILKAKLKENFQVTMVDGLNAPIKIMTGDEAVEAMRSAK